MKYKINENYFDTIDTEDKAYWLGFIWADGYVNKRDRPNSIEYNLKLSVAPVDENHLIKFKCYSESTHPIKTYRNSSGFATVDGEKTYEKRFFLCNKHMCSTLFNRYGIIPFRTDFTKCSSQVPSDLRRHFIRGIFDGDGCISHYYIQGKNQKYEKLCVKFTTNTQAVDFIEDYLIEKGVISDMKRVRFKRHEGRDGDCIELNLSGMIQGRKVLAEMYEDSKVYLDRKYEKYKEI